MGCVRVTALRNTGRSGPYKARPYLSNSYLVGLTSFPSFSGIVPIPLATTMF